MSGKCALDQGVLHVRDVRWDGEADGGATGSARASRWVDTCLSAVCTSCISQRLNPFSSLILLWRLEKCTVDQIILTEKKFPNHCATKRTQPFIPLLNGQIWLVRRWWLIFYKITPLSSVRMAIHMFIRSTLIQYIISFCIVATYNPAI